ncbi:lipopolysaccharide biosynthesis protein [Parasphingorhabdus sp.]|uniref:lipopolysaccharide biosynthesis protein n=1 Tax=Parasphingorhabdus sp. TaxID=2709688 RepID=UPI003D28CA4D
MLKNRISKWTQSEDSLVRVFRNSSWLFSAKGIGAILSIFYLALLTRSLGVSGFGEFMMIVSAVQLLAAILKLQTWQAVVRFGAPYLLTGDDRAFRKLSIRSFLIELSGGILACGALWLLLPVGGTHFGWSHSMALAIMGYGAVVFLSVRSTAIGILRAQDRFGGNAAGDAIIPLVRFTGAILLFFATPTIAGFLVVWALSEFISFLFMWFLVARNRKVIAQPASSQLPVIAPSWPEFFSFLFFTNLAFLANVIRERLVVVIVGIFVGPTAAGLYRLADQLANSVNRLAEVFARPLFAELSKLFAGNESDRLTGLFWRSLRVSAVSGAVMFLALVLLGQFMIDVISGPEFLAAYPILLLLGAATIISLSGLGLEPLLQAANRAHVALIAKLAGLTALAMAMTLLLPKYGTMGVSWAMLLSAIITTILLFLFSRSAIAKPHPAA